MTLDQLNKLANEMWEGCHHCDEYDKQMWINGFVNGYLHAEFNNEFNDDDEENDKEINPA
jgi:hypothetical protein